MPLLADHLSELNTHFAELQPYRFPVQNSGPPPLVSITLLVQPTYSGEFPSSRIGGGEEGRVGAGDVRGSYRPFATQVKAFGRPLARRE